MMTLVGALVAELTPEQMRRVAARPEAHDAQDRHERKAFESIARTMRKTADERERGES
jgi:hypothetical protein